MTREYNEGEIRITCSIDGCDNRAVVSLMDPDWQDENKRCEDCLEYDLDL